MKKQLLIIKLMALFTLTSFAQTGTHLNFDGSNDRVSAPNIGALQLGTSNFTVEALIQYSGSIPNYSGIVSKSKKDPHPISGFQMVIVNNKLAFEITDGTTFLGVGDGLTGTTALNNSLWHHVAVVVDRASNNIKLFVNGSIEANVTNAGIGSLNVTSPDPLYLGSERNGSSFFKGNLDEVRVWNVSRSQTDINSYKTTELTGTETGLVQYFKFNQGVSAANNSGVVSLTDSSTSSNNGILSNFLLNGSTSNWLHGSPATLSTKDNSGEGYFKLFPNPASKNVTLESIQLKDAVVTVFDLKGRVLLIQNLQETSTKIDVSNLSNGLYIFKIKTDNSEFLKRIIKE